MSFLGNAAASAGKAAAQKGAQKTARKGAEKGTQKLGDAAAKRGTQKLGDATAKRTTQAGVETTKKTADKAAGGAREKLGDAAKKPGSPEKLGASDPKKILSEPKAKPDKSPETKIDDAKRAEKDALKEKGKEQKKPGEKNLLDKAKDAKKESDARSREEESTVGGKLKSVARDVGGGAASGAVGGAAVGAAAGGVGAAPGAAVGAMKGAAKGFLKNKTARGFLVAIIVAPALAITMVGVMVFGVMSNAMLAGVELNGGGSDSVTLAANSGIKEGRAEQAFEKSDESMYPWTLTVSWEETLKATNDESVRAFPAGRFAAAMEEVDPQGHYRQISVPLELNEPNDPSGKGGFIIPSDKEEWEQEKLDERQDTIRETWVSAILRAGTPEGGEEGSEERIDAKKTGGNIVVYGDTASSSASSVLGSVLPGIESVVSGTMSMSDASSRVASAATSGTIRPYVVVAAASTSPVSPEDLQSIYDVAGESFAVVFVTGYNQPEGVEEDEEGNKTETVKNEWIEESNQTIRDFVAANDRARLADWAASATENPQWLGEDGYSIWSQEGKQRYSDLISEAIEALPTIKTDPGITRKQAEAVYDRALALHLGVGIDSCGATTQTPVDGEEGGDGGLNSVQLAHALTAMGVARGMFPNDVESARQAALISLMTMKVETGFKNYANSTVPASLNIPNDAVGKDHDSVGLMQQRVSGSWGNVGDSNYGSDPTGTVTRLMTPSYAIGKFISVLVTKEDWLTGDRGKLAQSVQVSAFPDRYAEEEPFAQALISEHFSGTPPIEPHSGLGWGGVEKEGSSQMSACGSVLGEGTMGEGASPIPEGSGTVSSLYGPRDCSNGIASCFHKGVDLAGFGGTSGKRCVADIPIYSISNGVVEHAPDPGYGANNAIAIKYSDQLTFRYLHMGTDSFKVKAGDTVTAGQQIASMGSYGASTGCHLHIETRVGGESTDPLPVIEQGFGVPLPR